MNWIAGWRVTSILWWLGGNQRDIISYVHSRESWKSYDNWADIEHMEKNLVTLGDNHWLIMISLSTTRRKLVTVTRKHGCWHQGHGEHGDTESLASRYHGMTKETSGCFYQFLAFIFTDAMEIVSQELYTRDVHRPYNPQKSSHPIPTKGLKLLVMEKDKLRNRSWRTELWTRLLSRFRTS